MQCALAWYTGAFADRERQLGVEVLLDAVLGTNNSLLKAALLAEKLGADIDIGFDDSTLQPVLELVLRGATRETAGRFSAAVRKAVDGILTEGIPQELLLASLNAAEFASLERPGSLYLNFYYDLGNVKPEDMQYLDLLTDVLDELDSSKHTARQLNTLRSTWLGDSRVQLDIWTGRQEGAPCCRKAALPSRAVLRQDPTPSR